MKSGECDMTKCVNWTEKKKKRPKMKKYPAKWSWWKKKSLYKCFSRFRRTPTFPRNNFSKGERESFQDKFFQVFLSILELSPPPPFIIPPRIIPQFNFFWIILASPGTFTILKNNINNFSREYTKPKNKKIIQVLK